MWSVKQFVEMYASLRWCTTTPCRAGSTNLSVIVPGAAIALVVGLSASEIVDKARKKSKFYTWRLAKRLSTMRLLQVVGALGANAGRAADVLDEGQQRARGDCLRVPYWPSSLRR